jgi:hypothetical protein
VGFLFSARAKPALARAENKKPWAKRWF